MDKKRYHAVSWHIITIPRAEGGLGLGKLEYMNTVCIMKLVLQLHYKEDVLWCKVLKSKYRVANSTNLRCKGCVSKLWSDIVKVDEQVQGLGNWCIDDG